MKTKLMFCLLALAPLAAGCGDDTTPAMNDLAAPPDLSMTPTPDLAPAGPPTVGEQIDRFGRPAINTALTDPFWDDGVQTVDQHHARQDGYNAISDPTKWGTTTVDGATVAARFAGALAAYDGLDNTCGNQVAFNGPLGNDYATLTAVLVDDELYVDTSTTTCQTYLAVELETLGVSLTDCGGRTLTENTIDETYNALALGMATGPVTSGVTSDATGSESNTTFPYLGAPN